MKSAIISVIALASSVSAVGNAIVKNNCPSTFYLWSVSSTVGNRQTIAPGKSYTEVLHRDATTGGIALKITKTADGLYTGAPTQIFSYSLDGAQVWYDLSTVFGEPFNGQHITVTSKGGATIDWPKGSNPRVLEMLELGDIRLAGRLGMVSFVDTLLLAYRDERFG